MALAQGATGPLWGTAGRRARAGTGLFLAVGVGKEWACTAGPVLAPFPLPAPRGESLLSPCQHPGQGSRNLHMNGCWCQSTCVPRAAELPSWCGPRGWSWWVGGWMGGGVMVSWMCAALSPVPSTLPGWRHLGLTPGLVSLGLNPSFSSRRLVRLHQDAPRPRPRQPRAATALRADASSRGGRADPLVSGAGPPPPAAGPPRTTSAPPPSSPRRGPPVLTAPGVGGTQGVFKEVHVSRQGGLGGGWLRVFTWGWASFGVKISR